MPWLLALVVFAKVDMLERANAAYDDYEFDKAAAYYRDALSLGIENTDKLADARLKYAFSLFISDPTSRPEAQRQLQALFALRPKHKLDEKGLHPDLVKLYREERAAFEKKQQKEIVAAPPPVVKKEAPPPAPPPPPYEPAHWALRLLPLGIGQFANGDPVGGALWLSGEVALTALHITAVFMQERSREQGLPSEYNYSDPSAVSWWYVRTISASALIATAILGIVDAFVWSPGRARARVLPVALANGAGLGTFITF